MSPNPRTAAAAPPPSNEPSTARLIGEELGATLGAAFVEPFVEQVVESVRFGLLAMVMVPIGIVVFVATTVAFVGAFLALGSPTGVLATILLFAWLAGTVVLLFFVLRGVYRRMPGRRNRSTITNALAAKPVFAGGQLSALLGGEPAVQAPAAAVPTPSLAELDARLAPEPPPEPRRDAP